MKAFKTQIGRRSTSFVRERKREKNKKRKTSRKNVLQQVYFIFNWLHISGFYARELA